MQIVIDIPEEVKHKVYAYGLSLCPSDKEQLIHAIINGIPLPKGHGRLKDVDHYIKINWDHPDYSLMDDEPTIIEADSEVKE